AHEQHAEHAEPVEGREAHALDEHGGERERDDDHRREQERHADLRREVGGRRHRRDALQAHPALAPLRRHAHPEGEQRGRDDAGGAVGGEEVARRAHPLRLPAAEDRAEEQEEHQGEGQRGDAVDRQPEQLEELEPRLGGDELDEVAPRPSGGGPGGDGGGGHACTPSVKATASRPPPVMLRNASSRVAPFTSRPWRPSSAASSALTVASAWEVWRFTATPTRSTRVTPGRSARRSSGSRVTALTTLPAVRALISAGVP